MIKTKIFKSDIERRMNVLKHAYPNTKVKIARNFNIPNNLKKLSIEDIIENYKNYDLKIEKVFKTDPIAHYLNLGYKIERFGLTHSYGATYDKLSIELSKTRTEEEYVQYIQNMFDSSYEVVNDDEEMEMKQMKNNYKKYNQYLFLKNWVKENGFEE